MEDRKIEMRICEECKCQFYSFTLTKCLNCNGQKTVDSKSINVIENLVSERLQTTANNTWADYEVMEDSADMLYNVISLLTDLTGLMYKKGILNKDEIEQKLLSGVRE